MLSPTTPPKGLPWNTCELQSSKSSSEFPVPISLSDWPAACDKALLLFPWLQNNTLSDFSFGLTASPCSVSLLVPSPFIDVLIVHWSTTQYLFFIYTYSGDLIQSHGFKHMVEALNLVSPARISLFNSRLIHKTAYFISSLGSWTDISKSPWTQPLTFPLKHTPSVAFFIYAEGNPIFTVIQSKTLGTKKEISILMWRQIVKSHIYLKILNSFKLLSIDCEVSEWDFDYS